MLKCRAIVTMEIDMETELSILQHSLGVDEYGRGNQYRNHFVTAPGSDNYEICQKLVESGLMVSRGSSALTGGGTCFVVTPKGIDYVAFNSPKPPKLTRSQQQYRDYLESESIARLLNGWDSN